MIYPCRGHRAVFLLVIFLLAGTVLEAAPPIVSTEDADDVSILSATGKAGAPLTAQALSRFISSHPAAQAGEEYLPVLLSLLKPDHVHRQLRVTGMELVYPGYALPLEKILPDLLEAKHPRVRALARLVSLLLDLQYSRTASVEAALKAEDDWEAYALFLEALHEGTPIGDEQLLQALDPDRPSLAAAALENRFAAYYLELNLPSLDSLNLHQDVRKAILKKCLAMTKLAEPRLILPVLHTLILVGQAEYLQEIIVLSTHQVPEVRSLAYQGLIRFADTSLFRYFLAGLQDSSNDVRYLSIQGLGAIRDVRGIEPLAAILNNTAEMMYLRRACAIALGKIGDRRIASILTNVLLLPQDGRGYDASIRIEAARALGQLREQSAVEALLANINPVEDSQLNYECLVALGKINSQTGFKKLLPLVEKGLPAWTMTKDTYSSLYAALGALFLHQSLEADSLYRQVFNTYGTVSHQFDPCGYVAAWHLLRGAADKNAPEAQPFRVYMDTHRASFFSNELRIYYFCQILEGKWEEENLAFLSSHVSEYDTTIKTWVLSSMVAQPSLSFITAVEQVAADSNESVRAWASSLLYQISFIFTRKDTSDTEDLNMAADRISRIIEAWKSTEENSKILRYLEGASTQIKLYKEKQGVSFSS